MKKRIYLFKSGTLKCQDGSLVYITKNEKNYIPIIQTEIIYIFGNCTLNKSTLQLLTEHNIKVYFFSYNGNYFGSYIPKRNYIGKVLLAQTELLKDLEKTFIFQKEIIYSSICNMIAVLKYYQKKRHINFSQILELEKIKEQVLELQLINSNSLLILEARSKQIYYDAFNRVILNSDFTFTKRTTYPPQDELNAIMSYGYAILYGLVETAIYTSNLMPQLGIIHGISKPDSSLKYDVADIFKPVIIDRLIFRMINKKQLSKNYFEKRNSGVYLTKDGAVIFIEELESLLQSTVTVANRKLSYRSIINREIYNLEKAIVKQTKYKGYRMEW